MIKLNLKRAITNFSRSEPVTRDKWPELQAFADAVNNGTWNYKATAPVGDDEEHSGPMAQELEEVPAFASCVHDTPQGKIVDTEAAVLPLIGIVADLTKKSLMEEGENNGRSS